MDSQLSVLWAKSDLRHALWKHLLDVAAVSLELPKPRALKDWNPHELALIVSLHDIGKADSSFQHQVPGFEAELTSAGFIKTADSKCRHERISAAFVKKTLEHNLRSEREADTIARAIVAHHGYWDDSSRPSAPTYANAQQQLFELLMQTLEISDLKFPAIENHSALGMSLAGHLVLADWLASDQYFFTDPSLRGLEDPTKYLQAARELAKQKIETLGLDRKSHPAQPHQVVSTPRPLQTALLESEIPPSLVIIEAPMGEGKTEAAWILAEKWRNYGYHGTYMALPTMATSDSLYERYLDTYLKRLGHGEDTKLVHGMAWLRDEKEAEKPAEVGETGDDQTGAAAWFRPTRRAMLAAHGVGTVDQAMLAGMHVKFGFLRLFGLSNRVLVIDEVHAYDAYMSAIIYRLLQWCSNLEIPVILLSATLSKVQREQMIEAYSWAGSPRPSEGEGAGGEGSEIPYPRITIAESGKFSRHINPKASSTRELKFRCHSGLLGDANGTAKKAAALVKEGGCCCVILNTVKQAQAVYSQLPRDIPKLLFHARFTAEDRERITKKVTELFGKDTTNRPEKFILVATQVVEQSLDVDFDHMMTELAPMDLLLQRSGRLHRHRVRAELPVLHILTPTNGQRNFGGTSFVYAEKPLLRTLALLSSRTSASLPDDFRPLIERTYGTERWESEEIDWDAIEQADAEWIKETELESAQGTHFVLNTPSRRVFRPVNNAPSGDDSDDGNGWRAKTRLGANDRTAVLVSPLELATLSRGQLSKQAIKEVYRRSLKLARYLPVFQPLTGFDAAIEADGNMKGLLLLPVSEQGCWKGADDKMKLYEIRYDQELGLLARKSE